MIRGMNAFLSEAAQREHREYLLEMNYKASIYKKSGIDVKGLSERQLAVLRLSREEREMIKNLLFDIKMHELYFNSFADKFIPSEKVKKCFGSENSFAFELLRLGLKKPMGFVCVFSDRAGRIDFCEAESLPKGAEALLAIDVSEHAYFRDYGFKKEKYLRSALAHLDFGVINGFSKNDKAPENKP